MWSWSIICRPFCGAFVSPMHLTQTVTPLNALKSPVPWLTKHTPRIRWTGEALFSHPSLRTFRSLPAPFISPIDEHKYRIFWQSVGEKHIERLWGYCQESLLIKHGELSAHSSTRSDDCVHSSVDAVQAVLTCLAETIREQRCQWSPLQRTP